MAETIFVALVAKDLTDLTGAAHRLPMKQKITNMEVLELETEFQIILLFP